MVPHQLFAAWISPGAARGWVQVNVVSARVEFEVIVFEDQRGTVEVDGANMSDNKRVISDGGSMTANRRHELCNQICFDGRIWRYNAPDFTAYQAVERR